MRRIIRIFIFLAVFVLLGASCTPEQQQQISDVMTDDKMMEDDAMEDDAMMDDKTSYSGKVLAGSSAPLLDFNQSDYQKAFTSGKTVFLYFYANWCPICAEE